MTSPLQGARPGSLGVPEVPWSPSWRAEPGFACCIGVLEHVAWLPKRGPATWELPLRTPWHLPACPLPPPWDAGGQGQRSEQVAQMGDPPAWEPLRSLGDRAKPAGGHLAQRVCLLQETARPVARVGQPHPHGTRGPHCEAGWVRDTQPASDGNYSGKKNPTTFRKAKPEFARSQRDADAPGRC